MKKKKKRRLDQILFNPWITSSFEIHVIRVESTIDSTIYQKYNSVEEWCGARPPPSIAEECGGYDFVKDIESGSFGVAKLMRERRTMELVAVKFIPRGEDTTSKTINMFL